ncbi:MAG: diguanylate cyclase [Gemmatimonadaceae bacterium]|nr:diguanylate cyclase [Gemmatimonadaceae bacterium]
MPPSLPTPPLQALLDQGRLAQARGQHQEARELYERGLHSLTSTTSASTIAQLLLSVGQTHLDTRNTSAALDCVEAAVALAGEPDMDVALALAMELRGRIRWLDGQMDEAEADFRDSRQRALSARRPGIAALGASQLGAVAIVRGTPIDAVHHFEAALAEFRATGETDAAGRTLEQLATLYADLKRWNAAEQAFAEAALSLQAGGDDRRLASLELARGDMALDRTNVERARASAALALDAARRADDSGLEARAIALSGMVARELGDAARAERLLDQADRQAQAADDLLLVAEVAREKADLFARLDRHMHALLALNRTHRALIQLRARGIDVAVVRRIHRLEEGFLDVVRRWAQRMESRDHATTGHCERVADLTCEIARRMGVDGGALFWYRVGAYLHDIGKLEVPASLLNKPDRLTSDEWAVVKRHPVAGAEMLRAVDFPWEVRPMVESHHECWDGSGYPHGLAGDEIPLAARIVTVADVFDALVSRRSFKRALAPDDALDVMRRNVGRHFDPAVFKVFEEVLRDGIAIPGVTSAASIPSRVEVRETPLLDDALTSVADYASWFERAVRVLADSRSSGQHVALLTLDIDHFSRLNATYGRLQGDDILWAVAKVLQRGLRTDDLIGRRGSDEFLVLLPDTSSEVALEIAERLRDASARLRSARRDAPEEEIAISVSVAVSSTSQHGGTIQLLLAAGDRALFQAKRDGRAGVAVADHADAPSARAQMDFEAFVAREHELRTLVAQLDRASRGDARLACITGEEGIGKTALVRQLEPEIGLRSGAMVYAQSLQGDQTSPYGAWSDVIERLHSLGHLPENDWRALPQLVPAMAPPSDGDEWALTPSLLQEEIVRAVRRAARQQLLVLVFEDMQWADAASWAVLLALLAAMDGERVFIVLTLRPDDARHSTEWRRRVAQHPRALQVALQRFSADEMRRLTQVVMRDADLGEELPRFLHTYTEGIPLFVVHVLRALAEAGAIWYSGTRWEWRPVNELALPPGVAFVFERRLERLSPAAREVLAAAAVLGTTTPHGVHSTTPSHGLYSTTFCTELLIAATAVPEAQVYAALDEGSAAGVISPVGDQRSGRYTFLHDLLADACTRGVVERQRQRMHEVTARLLELRAPSGVEAIAAHYHAAGLDTEAYRYAITAADHAARVFAHDAAMDALHVAQRYAPSAVDLALVRARQGQTAHDTGRYELAEELCDLALEWLVAAGDVSRTIAVRRLRAQVRVRRGAAPQRTLDALHTMLASAEGALDREERATTLLAAAEVSASLADWSRAASLAGKATDIIGDHAAPAIVGNAWRLLGIGRYATAPAESMALLREAIDRLGASGDRFGEALARVALGDAYLRAGHATHAEQALSVALDTARGAHSAPIAAVVSRSLAELRARQGAFDEAAQWLGDADRLFTALGDQPELLRTTLTRAHVARDRGDRVRAFALYDSASADARALEVPWIELTALAGCALSNGGPDAASTRERWARANTLIAGARCDWWFPGREMLDALALQMALSAGHNGVAFDMFARSSRVLDAVEPYAAAWLVAECGDVLDAAGFPAIADARRLATERVSAMHFAPLAPRLGSS